MSTRTIARLGAVPTVLGLAVLGLAGPASAHVTITAADTAAGAYTVLTVSVPHGCEGSSTTGVSIQIPEEINAVTPTRNALWDVEKELTDLDPPISDSHGNEITERVSTVTYTTEDPLPDGYRDSFELSLQLPEAEGTTLVFPVVQTCEKGESAWIEVPAEGQSEDDLALPAPAITITAAESDEPEMVEEPASTEPADERTDAEAADDSEGDSLGAWGLGAGALGVVLGGVALLQGRRRS